MKKVCHTILGILLAPIIIPCLLIEFYIIDPVKKKLVKSMPIEDRPDYNLYFYKIVKKDENGKFPRPKVPHHIQSASIMYARGALNGWGWYDILPIVENEDNEKMFFIEITCNDYFDAVFNVGKPMEVEGQGPASKPKGVNNDIKKSSNNPL